jgi:hypothetical protein
VRPLCHGSAPARVSRSPLLLLLLTAQLLLPLNHAQAHPAHRSATGRGPGLRARISSARRRTQSPSCERCASSHPFSFFSVFSIPGLALFSTRSIPGRGRRAPRQESPSLAQLRFRCGSLPTYTAAVLGLARGCSLWFSSHASAQRLRHPCVGSSCSRSRWRPASVSPRRSASLAAATTPAAVTTTRATPSTAPARTTVAWVRTEGGGETKQKKKKTRHSAPFRASPALPRKHSQTPTETRPSWYTAH